MKLFDYFFRKAFKSEDASYFSHSESFEDKIIRIKEIN